EEPALRIAHSGWRDDPLSVVASPAPLFHQVRFARFQLAQGFGERADTHFLRRVADDAKLHRFGDRVQPRYEHCPFRIEEAKSGHLPVLREQADARYAAERAEHAGLVPIVTFTVPAEF